MAKNDEAEREQISERATILSDVDVPAEIEERLKREREDGGPELDLEEGHDGR